MRNLKPYNKDSFDTYNAILALKKNVQLRGRLSVLDEVIRKQYKIYEDYFAKNTLERLVPLKIDQADKDSLLKLYEFKSKIIQEIKKDVTTTETNRIINTCQNCTINAINSFDHYLPKTNFVQFVVNPKNLFPSCTECNGYKGNFWKTDDKRLFLNLYLDILPEVQYLFAYVKNNGAEVIFELKNTGIDSGLFRIIESHYQRLHLLERFRINSSDVITEFINTISGYKQHLPMDVIVKITQDNEAKNQKSLGYNFWKTVLKLALLNNDEFLSYVLDNS